MWVVALIYFVDTFRLNLNIKKVISFDEFFAKFRQTEVPHVTLTLVYVYYVFYSLSQNGLILSQDME